MSRRTLVLGGARSGKSAHAEGLLSAGAATYVATARRTPGDVEWDQRIAEHAARRPQQWSTLELPEPEQLAHTLRAASADAAPLLVDDLATWLTNLLDDVHAWERAPEALQSVAEHRATLVTAVRDCAAPVVLVSAEVGLGVVPSTRAGRLFRDELGALNAALAEMCAEVVLLVAGRTLQLH